MTGWDPVVIAGAGNCVHLGYEGSVSLPLLRMPDIELA
jgi:hypothetical protein